MKPARILIVFLLLLFNASASLAADELDSGDTAWIIVSTALVMMMTPAGLALFYGGMSRYKNLLNTFAMTFVSYCLASVIWVLWGYSLAFGPSVGGLVGLSSSLIIGLVAGLLGFYSVSKLKKILGYDDSLDAFGVHGMCGIWGALATGLFADPAITAGSTGLFFGNPRQLWIQFVSIIATAAYTAIGTLIVIYITKWIASGLRVDEDSEISGLDNSLHGERGFEIA